MSPTVRLKVKRGWEAACEHTRRIVPPTTWSTTAPRGCLAPQKILSPSPTHTALPQTHVWPGDTAPSALMARPFHVPRPFTPRFHRRKATRRAA